LHQGPQRPWSLVDERCQREAVVPLHARVSWYRPRSSSRRASVSRFGNISFTQRSSGAVQSSEGKPSPPYLLGCPK
jgi:hypothetical protein